MGPEVGIIPIQCHLPLLWSWRSTAGTLVMLSEPAVPVGTRKLAKTSRDYLEVMGTLTTLYRNCLGGDRYSIALVVFWTVQKHVPFCPFGNRIPCWLTLGLTNSYGDPFWYQHFVGVFSIFVPSFLLPPSSFAPFSPYLSSLSGLSKAAVGITTVVIQSTFMKLFLYHSSK